jgi:hypothetical protein
MFAELAASVAAEAADIAAPVAALVSAGGGVTTVVAGAVAGGVVVVVVVSSFLLQAANETAAARVTISNAVFMFLLDFGSSSMTGKCGTLDRRAPASARQGKPEHFQCLACDYRLLRGFP